MAAKLAQACPYRYPSTSMKRYETAFICCLPTKDSMDCKESNGGKALGSGAIFAFEMKSAVNVSGGIVNEGFTGL